MAAPPANFGSPPSGQIPILFNDHHVYTKPDILKQGRVLAALVRGGTVLIPLRSMFEQMGATVSYDASQQDGGRQQTRRRGESDRRQAGSHHQRRIASAGRSADHVPGQRSRAGPRDFGRHGRIRAVGCRTSSSSSCGTSRRRRRRLRHRRRRTPPPPTPTPDPDAHARIRTCSSPATTSSRRRSTTSSAPATRTATTQRLLVSAIHGACGVQSRSTCRG